MELKFVLLGQLVSGKNQVQITRKGHRYPKQNFIKWRGDNEGQLYQQLPDLSRAFKVIYPKPTRIAMSVLYTPGDKIRRDAPGMIDALCHLLEHAGIVDDDAQVKGVTWKEMELDRDNPHVQLTLNTLSAGEE